MTDTIDTLLTAARERLQGMPRERLGELREPRRLLGIPRASKIVPHGSAWHLGVLLLTDDDLLATGAIIRARGEAPRGYTAESQRHRAAHAAAARRGGFAEGEVVHVGWSTIDLEALAQGEASGPIAVRDGGPRVRWSAAGGFRPLSDYLDERIALLAEPPKGA